MTPFPYTMLYNTLSFPPGSEVFSPHQAAPPFFVQLASAHIDPFALEDLHLADAQPSALSSGIAFQTPIIPQAHPWLHILPLFTGFQPESPTGLWEGWAILYCYFLFPGPRSVIGM